MFRMNNCNSVSTPPKMGLKLVKNPEGRKVDSTLYKQIVGSLMYLIATKPDIMYVVSLSPKEIHLLAAKGIFRYLKGIVNYGLFYKKDKKLDLFGFIDSDYDGDTDNRKSTSAYIFMTGSRAVSCSSRKQSIVTFLTTEAEFVEATECVLLD